MEAEMEKRRKSEIKALLENMELVKETKLKTITYMTMVLSQLAPQYYTKTELADIAKFRQSLYLKTNLPLNLPNMVEAENVEIKKRCRLRAECRTSYEERMVKSKISKKGVSKKHAEETQPLPPPQLPIHLKNFIDILDGSDIKYIMCKKLFMSDLNEKSNRLSMPLTQIKSDFLTEAEKMTLNTKDQEGKPVGIEVIVLDPNYKEFRMFLKKWNMKTSSVYSIINDWSLVMKENEFKKTQIFNIWSFRVNDKLHILLDGYVAQENGELNNLVVNSNNE